MLEGTGVPKTDPRINLMHADPAGLPPTMIFYGDQEILSGDAIDFAEFAACTLQRSRPTKAIRPRPSR
jgi:hypothetical protein